MQQTKTKTFKGLDFHQGQKIIVKDILSTDSMFYTICTPRQFGKSTMAIQLMLGFAINNPNSKLMYCSVTYSQCSKVYRELLKGIENSGIVKTKNSAENSVIFINNSEIYFKSVQQPDNLRGYSIDYMYCDEAAMYKEDLFNTILRPMLTVRGKKCFLFSTPKGKNWFYKMYMLGQNENEDRYRSYIGSNKDNPFANQEEIQDAKKALPEAIFRQEYLAEFVDGGEVFRNLSRIAILENWQQAEYKETYYCGIDIGMTNDFLVMTILNSKGEVVNCYRDTKQTMQYMMMSMKNMFDKYQPKLTLVETNGIGNGVYEYIAKLHRSVKPFTTTNKTKQDIIEDLIFDIQDDKIRIPSKDFFPYYYNEMSDYGFTYSPKTRSVVYNSISDHDDCVISLAIANNAKRNGSNVGKYILSVV